MLTDEDIVEAAKLLQKVTDIRNCANRIREQQEDVVYVVISDIRRARNLTPSGGLHLPKDLAAGLVMREAAAFEARLEEIRSKYSVREDSVPPQEG